MARGNKKDPQYVVLQIKTLAIPGRARTMIRTVNAMHTFDARDDARDFAALKNSRSRGRVLYRVQRVTPGPINRSR